MLALATVVEIDNRYTRQRFKVILPHAPAPADCPAEEVPHRG